jgi:hypothetical protein
MLLSHTTNPLWWTVFQMLVWIAWRIEMPPQDAEQFCYAPENGDDVKAALKELTTALFRVIYGVVDGLPIVAARIHGEDLATIFRRSWVPGAEDTLFRELREFIMKFDVRFNPLWGKGTPWPAPPTVLTMRAEAPPVNLRRDRKIVVTGNFNVEEIHDRPQSAQSPADAESGAVTASTETVGAQPRERRRPARGPVLLVLRDLWSPNGVPPDHVSNPEIIQAVGKALEAKNQKIPDRKTILRAAGRDSS